MQGRDLYNLQEAYLEVYDNLNEASRPPTSPHTNYRRFPWRRVGKKIDDMQKNPNIDTLFGPDAKRRNDMMRIYKDMRREVHPLTRAHSPKSSQAKEQKNRATGAAKRSKDNNGQINASYEYDIYDNLNEASPSSHRRNMTLGERQRKTGVSAEECFNYILSYLLDEGYANTLDSAEVILENMSDDWINSIMEAEGFYGQAPKTASKYFIRAQRLYNKSYRTKNPNRGLLALSLANDAQNRGYGATNREDPTGESGYPGQRHYGDKTRRAPVPRRVTPQGRGSRAARRAANLRGS